MTPSTVTHPADELRAEVARQMVPIFKLAALVDVHPSHLGQMLRGRRPFSPGVEERLRHVLAGNAVTNRHGHAA